MIRIEGQLCYSPLPPQSYGKRGAGHGILARDDIQLWNLMYISYPILDEYLKPETDAVRMIQELPMIVIGGPRAALNGQHNQELFPFLRGALKSPPLSFVQHLWTMQWPLLPMALHDSNWIDTVIQRANQIEREHRETTPSTVGNVTTVKFGSH